MCLAALAGGCGGGSERSADHNGTRPDSPRPPAAAALQAPEGRLGAAVVARPGELHESHRVRPITGRLALPPNARKGVGAESSCADAQMQPTASNLSHVADVLLCLMNAMRDNAGVPRLAQQEQLAEASVGHSEDMVARKYFAHDSLDGRDLVARLEESDYIPKGGQWVVGENLAWGAGTFATPRALVNAWMNSEAHRDNLLSGDFEEVGLGLVFGTPTQDAGDGVTVTTDFGTRVEDVGDDAVVAGRRASRSAAARRRAVGRRRAVARRRRAAVRRCARKRGTARRRCVRRARRIG